MSAISPIAGGSRSFKRIPLEFETCDHFRFIFAFADIYALDTTASFIFFETIYTSVQHINTITNISIYLISTISIVPSISLFQDWKHQKVTASSSYCFLTKSIYNIDVWFYSEQIK